MKSAIYIEDGVVQLVITPESEFEKDALRSFKESGQDSTVVEAVIFRGSFYDCRGGWVRQSRYLPHAYDLGDGADHSLIIRATPKEKEKREIRKEEPNELAL